MKKGDRWLMAMNFWLSGWFAAATTFALMNDGPGGVLVTSPVLCLLMLMLGLQKLARVKVQE